MTVCEAYHSIIAQLTKAGCDSPAFDACCLLEDFGGLPHGKRPTDEQRVLTAEQQQRLLTAAERRANGEPLQYLLGEWDFLNLTLTVGEGVLIPRADTECLCETAAACLQTVAHPQVLDLCAGSGCVGLGVCSLLPTATVTAVELSDAALQYLQANIRRYPMLDVTAVQDDVLSPQRQYPSVDAILSNPPYIPTATLSTLMREVQHEPRMALDGDADGLRFYRAIVTDWLPLLKENGLLAVEVGIGQAADVRGLFADAGLTDVSVAKDLNGIDRVVYGHRQDSCGVVK